MKQFTVLALSIAISTTSAGIVFADSGHGHEDNAEEKSNNSGAAMGGEDHGMMRMMMRMHAGMMDQDMMHGMMGNGGMHGMPDSAMSMFDSDGDGTVTSEEAHGQLQAMHSSFDADGDGSLSIEEFEDLHNSMTREVMVDRFQSFDADGDGNITAGEITAPADMMEPMQKMHSSMKGEGMENN